MGILLWLFFFIMLQVHIEKRLFPLAIKFYHRVVRVVTVTIVLLTLFFFELYINETRGHLCCISGGPDDSPFHYFLSISWKLIVLWEFIAYVVNRRMSDVLTTA